ncbi:P-loop containing nucleoside triphosphate hydrolase protein [Zopfochytrium polystomum]|nr:P-loop containing nucleoside triphosphate hydrolase protein [Zopfochytrium polystomum]
MTSTATNPPTQMQAIRAAVAALPPTDLAIELRAFNFDFGGPRILSDLDLSLPRGSRTLLVGANGAGKSTLLRVLAGKTLCRLGIRVLGKHPFFESSTGITYLGTEWAMNPVVRRDVPVSRLLKTLGAERYPDRCARLLDIMDVNVDWHMHEVSDGQRRRVQIVLGLMEPWDLLLLDEVTVDLDVLVRRDLLEFLREETSSRGATIMYATHIFDSLGGWPSHVVHIAEGVIDAVREVESADGFPELAAARERARAMGGDNSPLLMVVEEWLRRDFEQRKRSALRRDAAGRQMTRWEMLSENMKEYGDKYYNYYNGRE